MTTEEIAAAKETGRRLQDEIVRPLKAQEAADQNSHLLLLGDPGSGKSTFVRQLTARYATALLEGETQPLPIFIVLHELIPGLNALFQDPDFPKARQRDQQRQLSDLLTSEWTRRLEEWGIAELEAELLTLARSADKGQILLVLDGLDEVPEQLRPLLFDAIPAVSHLYPAITRIIVTCRTRSYWEGMLLGFHASFLASFTDDQVANFVTAWYRTQQRLGRMDQRRADQNIQDLQNAARGNLRELASNPMLLTAMTIIHQQETKLPEQQVELYFLAVNVLMVRWQQGKDQVHHLSADLDALLADSRKLRRILEALAYEAHKTQASASTRKGDDQADNDDDETESHERQQPLSRGELLVLLEDRLAGDTQLANDFLDYIDHRAGLLVGRGGAVSQASDRETTNRKPQTYSFPHRTFQEYLAGCHMTQGRDYIRTYLSHLKEGDYWRVAARLGAEELFYNNRNENAVLDLAYDLCPVAEPHDDSAWRGVVWSGQMAALLGRSTIEADEKSDGGTAYLKRLLDRLVQLPTTECLTMIERAEAGQALGQLGDPRPGVGLKNALPNIDWIPIEAGPYIMGTDPKKDSEGFNDERPHFSCTLITEPYHISCYPITVTQYRAFIEASGYRERTFWTEAGWQWRESEEVAGPQTYSRVYQTPNHPQVGVSWYEAIAFCRWLSQELETEITLPSEAQWERAARHTDGRIYPWGDEFDPQRCNMIETGVGRTSAVGFFPSGNAARGAADLAGNVLEWSRTKWLDNYKGYEQKVNNDEEGDDRHVWRGGSFARAQLDVRCAYRYSYVPDRRDLSHGFRVVALRLWGTGDSDLWKLCRSALSG